MAKLQGVGNDECRMVQGGGWWGTFAVCAGIYATSFWYGWNDFRRAAARSFECHKYGFWRV